MPFHLRIQPNRQGTALLQRRVVRRPVPGLALRRGPTAHACQLPRWIHTGYPSPHLCNKAADMGKQQNFSAAQIKRFVTAARSADPNAIVEIVTAAGTVRILPESEPVADSPFDKWKANRNESETQRY